MDQLPNLRRRRPSLLTVGVLFAAVALLATAYMAPQVFAQATTTATKAAPESKDIEAKDAVATTTAAAPDDGSNRAEGFTNLAIVIALIVVPIVVGNWLAKSLKMPDHGWKFAVAIGTIAAAAVVVSRGEIKLGPDLSGGITLIYELADDSVNGPEAANVGGSAKSDGKKGDAKSSAADKNAASGAGSSSDSHADTIAQLISVLSERIDPAGTKEISIRKWGENSIEIVIPRAEKQELEYIERRISTAGMLVFRITASPAFKDHKRYIELANNLRPGEDILKVGDEEVARWVEIDETEFKTDAADPLEEANRRGLVTRMVGKTPQALVMTNDKLDVTGKVLKTVASDVDETGKPQVSFTFDSTGAFLFGRLTGEHIPNASGQRYNLGILLDNRLLSAPTIESKITDRGRISGNMSEDEVTFLVGILKAGSLPAALNKVPISRAQISPTLGAQTIEKGRISLAISLLLVAIFMVFYYRASGIIACFGLAINMLLIVGSMVLIKAAFTLPGLAGLVLTVGMSVDANVLIYERIREELKRGAALRMAIRNGFDRASITIIDSNVTNLITGIVIYKIAPDNVKGFGITLVLGIAMSIFVAVFLTRIAFDVVERKGLIKNLRMREFIGETNMDFLGWRGACIGGSLLVIGIGLLAVFARGGDLFDIDFTGGSSVQFVLKDGEAMKFDDVLGALEKTSLVDKNLSLVEIGEDDTHYSVTTVNDDITAVEKILADTFSGKLETYEVGVTEAKEIPATGDVGVLQPNYGAHMAGDLPLPMSFFTLLQAAPDQPAVSAPAAEADAATDDAKEADAEADEAPAADAAESDSEVAPSTETTATDDGKAAEKASDAAESDAQAADGKSGEAAEAADTADEEPAASSNTLNPFAAGGAKATITFRTPDKDSADALSDGVSYDAIEQLLVEALKAENKENVAYEITNPEYKRGSGRNFTDWEVSLALPPAEAQMVLEQIESQLDNQPVFPLSNKIGGRVAARMATDAVAAIVLCLAGIIGYVWFRFHGIMYGVAAVVALIHDVLVSLGFVALSAYFVYGAEPLANALLIDKFQVSLTLVAAFLTIIGYSLNDTIVIFDRIREVKGKSPKLTAEMINLAVNQCFARTLLTSFTSLISVTVLYIVGGTGIHAFAFALLVGFIAGVYSTIYIANPVLLWLTERADAAARNAKAKAA